MNRKDRLYDLIVTIGTSLLILYLIPLMLRYLYHYLREVLYIYVGWNLTAVFIGFTVLAAVYFIFFWRRAVKRFYAMPDGLMLCCALAVHLSLFFLNGNLIVNTFVSEFAAYFVRRRVSEMHLKRDVVAEQCQKVLMQHIGGLAAAGVCFMASVILNRSGMEALTSNLAIESEGWKTAFAVTLESIAVIGPTLLFRAVYGRRVADLVAANK
jgi:hypothetical protein